MAFEPVLAFARDSEDFVLGFECGRIWVLMEENPDKLEGLVFHAENAEMIMRMVDVKQIPLKAKFTDDERWMMLTDEV